jgi:hypothetical protein
MTASACARRVCARGREADLRGAETKAAQSEKLTVSKTEREASLNISSSNATF